jgi:hypothetical protein
MARSVRWQLFATDPPIREFKVHDGLPPLCVLSGYSRQRAIFGSMIEVEGEGRAYSNKAVVQKTWSAGWDIFSQGFITHTEGVAPVLQS